VSPAQLISIGVDTFGFRSTQVSVSVSWIACQFVTVDEREKLSKAILITPELKHPDHRSVNDRDKALARASLDISGPFITPFMVAVRIAFDVILAVGPRSARIAHL